ncbi:MAG: nitrogen fixation protein FixP [Bdellovibrio sp. 28-41-41]|nr:MAG: nitrogen fixation protein FixP [Bdellovibrio sp. 28-41-41]
MSNETDKEIAGHDYDGIKEYDNPLPGWWLMTFYGTIIFAFIYVIHYESGSGNTLKKDLEIAMAQIESVKTSTGPKVLDSEDVLLEKAKDPKLLVVGAENYQSKCASCHGAELQGMIGPNLTDDFWIHGKGNMTDIITTVRTGVPEKGMPPWEGILKNEEVLAVASFIHSKHGSKPANPKEPQGQKVE